MDLWSQHRGDRDWSQPRQSVNSRFSERACLKNQVEVIREEPNIALWSPDVLTQMCIHTGMHMCTDHINIYPQGW